METHANVIHIHDHRANVKGDVSHSEVMVSIVGAEEIDNSAECIKCSYYRFDYEVVYVRPGSGFEGMKGLRFSERLHCRNDDQELVDEAYVRLSMLCHATGVLNLTDSKELYHKPFWMRFEMVPAVGH